jgi:exopolysaccharide biosynthesis WecB/TagA/CpsF family protein
MDSVVSADPAPLALIDAQPVNIASEAELLARISARLKQGLGFTLFTLNLDHLVKRRNDPRFCAAYGRATFVTADGAPVVALARRQGAALERTTGADLVLPLCAAAARDGVPVFFFGSSRASLDKAAAELKRRFPALDLRGLEAPPMGFDPFAPAADAFGARIAGSGARLCFVLLGAPKQEFFADRMAARYPGLGFLCVGAALDFISGAQKRAPLLVRRLNLEWAWRMCSNPARLASRYARCAVLLANLVLLRRGAPAGAPNLQRS